MPTMLRCLLLQMFCVSMWVMAMATQPLESQFQLQLELDSELELEP